MAKRWWMIDKLFDSLESAKIDKEIRIKILQGWNRLPQKPKPAERATWMKKVIDRMDSLLEEEIRFKIREDCACCFSIQFSPTLPLLRRVLSALPKSEENNILDSVD